MTVARLIYVQVNPNKVEQAHRVWKQDCAPLMIKAPGCLSERMLESIDHRGEMISYSEWEDERSIDQFVKGPDHAEITRHTRGLADGSEPVVKHYYIAG